MQNPVFIIYIEILVSVSVSCYFCGKYRQLESVEMKNIYKIVISLWIECFVCNCQVFKRFRPMTMQQYQYSFN